MFTVRGRRVPVWLKTTQQGTGSAPRSGPLPYCIPIDRKGAPFGTSISEESIIVSAPSTVAHMSIVNQTLQSKFLCQKWPHQKLNTGVVYEMSKAYINKAGVDVIWTRFISNRLKTNSVVINLKKSSKSREIKNWQSGTLDHFCSFRENYLKPYPLPSFTQNWNSFHQRKSVISVIFSVIT